MNKQEKLHMQRETLAFLEGKHKEATEKKLFAAAKAFKTQINRQKEAIKATEELIQMEEAPDPAQETLPLEQDKKGKR